jgi:hypothetical protein
MTISGGRVSGTRLRPREPWNQPADQQEPQALSLRFLIERPIRMAPEAQRRAFVGESC